MKSYQKNLAFINYTYKAFDGWTNNDRILDRQLYQQQQFQRHQAALSSRSMLSDTTKSKKHPPTGSSS
ncbi:unnamed protein product [Trichobilharzia regenti]|nr:unnamed protein product [Trichobilharzia regenti]